MNIITIIQVGFFLAVREIKRANIWTTSLIVAVMMLTFLNLVVVSGILVGLIQGSVTAIKDRYTGDIIISHFTNKQYIEQSNDIIKFVETIPGVQAVSVRYIEAGKVEANYRERTRAGDLVDSTGGLVVGIDPEEENAVTHIGDYMLEGEFLSPDESDQIVVGANLLYKYTPIETPGLTTLKNVDVGSRVRLVVNGFSREVTIKGVLKTKVGEVDQRIFINDREFRQIIGRTDYNADEIVLKHNDTVTSEAIKNSLLAEGFGERARVQTSTDAQPKFLKDIQATFGLLGNIIGSIGLVVACITIFIIVFVNAITRRRYIGIMKGIGIDARAIELSYIIQSMFYAFFGVLLGALVVFLVLQPYLFAHPIDFPFSDGILAATPLGTFFRGLVLFLATIIAGYIPARMIVKQNTLDAILGR